MLPNKLTSLNKVRQRTDHRLYVLAEVWRQVVNVAADGHLLKSALVKLETARPILVSSFISRQWYRSRLHPPEGQQQLRERRSEFPGLRTGKALSNHQGALRFSLPAAPSRLQWALAGVPRLSMPRGLRPVSFRIGQGPNA